MILSAARGPVEHLADSINEDLSSSLKEAETEDASPR
jgi:hypothetical protein